MGSLLVRSTPSGATVTVDGVTRGVTPLALRDLDLGSRNVVIARRGYIAEDQRVVLTSARPSRSLEVRLTAEAAEAAALAEARATTGERRRTESSTGALAVESRPAGADGDDQRPAERHHAAEPRRDWRRASTASALALKGYQPFLTTVRVVAGERARAAASLSVQERE